MRTNRGSPPPSAPSAPAASFVVDIDDVSGMIKKSNRTIHAYHQAGQMPRAMKLPGHQKGRLIWLREDIENWLRQLARGAFIVSNVEPGKRAAGGGRPSKIEKIAAAQAGFNTVRAYRAALKAEQAVQS